jgi:hypothetical protein
MRVSVARAFSVRRARTREEEEEEEAGESNQQNVC